MGTKQHLIFLESSVLASGSQPFRLKGPLYNTNIHRLFSIHYSSISINNNAYFSTFLIY